MMDIPGAAAAINAMATIVYVFLTFHMLKELKRSREQNAKPRLTVLPPADAIEFKLGADDPFDFRRAAFFGEDDGLTGESALHSQNFPIKLKIKNVGLAPAIDVKVSWRIIGDDLQSILKSRKHFYSINAKIDGDFLAADSRRIRISQATDTHMPICIAAPQTEYTDDLEIPFGIMVRTFINMFFQDLSDFTKSRNFRLAADITYEDINENRYKQMCIISFEMIRAGQAELNQPFLGVGGEFCGRIKCSTTVHK